MSLSFASHLEVVPLQGRALVTIGERGCDIYPGPPFTRLAELVDGSRSREEILALCNDTEQDQITSALDQLTRAGVLVSSSANGSAPDAAWWSSQLVSPEVAAERLGRAAVSVHALAGIDPKATSDALSDAQVQLTGDAELMLVLTDDYLAASLAEHNRRALREDRAWMLASPEGPRILIGPIFQPGGGPCWECLAQRMRFHRAIERRLLGTAGNGGASGAPLKTGRPGAPRSMRGLGPALVATEITRWLAGARAGFESLIISFDAGTWETARHHVIQRPQCPECGVGDLSPGTRALPIKIREHRPDGTLGGALRSVSPEVTLRRLEHHVSPLTGAVASLTRVPGPEHLHVYTSGGPVARVHGDRTGWEALAGQLSAGKGTSDSVARAGALCEALERYSAIFSGDEPRRRATLEELGEPAISPNDQMNFSDRQYAQRQDWNARATSHRTHVPEPFDPSVPIDWSPVWSLTHERERLIPTALCYHGTAIVGRRYCVGDSNGNAAGNTVEEAILHGLLELVERDHVALWWYNRLRVPAIDLDTIDDPWLARLRAHITGQGRELWALDLTADLGLPVAVALVASADGTGVGLGFGAHVDLAGAAIRATTELVQLGLGAPSGGLGRGPDQMSLDQRPFLRSDPDQPARTCAADRLVEGEATAALDLCRRAIERRGIELLVLDQTRPDIGLPVVKVIAPGLRHFWPRFGPGRLYDVPVTLGRLERALDEDELDPTPPSG